MRNVKGDLAVLDAVCQNPAGAKTSCSTQKGLPTNGPL